MFKMFWLGYIFKVYWKELFILFYPLFLLFIFFVGLDPEIRCLYICLLLIGLWLTEALPTPITGILPIIFFPLFTIIDSKAISKYYLTDINMLFLSSIMIAVAIENCDFIKRLAIKVLLCAGHKPYVLIFALMIKTMLISMWLTNTSTVSILIPLIKEIVTQYEKGGVLMFKNRDEEDPDTGKPITEDYLKPTKFTICLYLALSYSASIGGISTVVGTNTNTVFITTMETITMERSKKDLSFLNWTSLCFPIALILILVVWFILILWHLGLFRRGSKDAQAITLDEEKKEALQQSLRNELEQLGKFKYKEVNMIILFILIILLWLFMKPYDFEGWAKKIADRHIAESTPAFLIVILTFVIPATTGFLHIFDKDEEKRPQKSGPGLCTWTLLQKNVPWGVLLLIGSINALAEGIKASNLKNRIQQTFRDVLNNKSVSNLTKVYLSGMFCLVMTQFLSSFITCQLLIPLFIEISLNFKINPLHFCMPAVLACSMAFSLPASTPPNAIVQAKGHLSVFDFLLIGLFLSVLTYTILWALVISYGKVFHAFNDSTNPEWANISLNITNITKA